MIKGWTKRVSYKNTFSRRFDFVSEGNYLNRVEAHNDWVLSHCAISYHRTNTRGKWLIGWGQEFCDFFATKIAFFYFLPHVPHIYFPYSVDVISCKHGEWNIGWRWLQKICCMSKSIQPGRTHRVRTMTTRCWVVLKHWYPKFTQSFFDPYYLWGKFRIGISP